MTHAFAKSRYTSPFEKHRHRARKLKIPIGYLTKGSVCVQMLWFYFPYSFFVFVLLCLACPVSFEIQEMTF